jgi:hypothetical protein
MSDTRLIERGTIIQFRADWGEVPTPRNTALVSRVAKDRSWCDVITPFGRKRVPIKDNLKVITEPLTVYVMEEV